MSVNRTQPPSKRTVCHGFANGLTPSPKTSPNPCNASLPWDAHVVILNNYLRPHHVASYRELAKRVRKLTILLSVAMEPDRDWQAQWENLNVRLQKNWTFTARWKHSAGFEEPNFIHLPIDTASQLKQLAPDIVFSYEMGIRTLLASWFRRSHANTPLVMVGNMSEYIENERGFFRRRLRGIIRRSADAFTFNGPSCRRYLQRIGIPDEQLFHLPYCIDKNVVSPDHVIAPEPGTTRLLYCGAISQRKGIVQFTANLQRWCQKNPSHNIVFSIAGDGPLVDQVTDHRATNLTLNILGNCSTAKMKEAYQNTDICVFPTLADEWGLVPVEAMASGVPVLGSRLAQSVETCVQDDINGWSYDPTQNQESVEAIDRALKCSPSRLRAMGDAARQSVTHITPEATADCFLNITQQLVPQNQ